MVGHFSPFFSCRPPRLVPAFAFGTPKGSKGSKTRKTPVPDDAVSAVVFLTTIQLGEQGWSIRNRCPLVDILPQHDGSSGICGIPPIETRLLEIMESCCWSPIQPSSILPDPSSTVATLGKHSNKPPASMISILTCVRHHV